MARHGAGGVQELRLEVVNNYLLSDLDGDPVILSADTRPL